MTTLKDIQDKIKEEGVPEPPVYHCVNCKKYSDGDHMLFVHQHKVAMGHDVFLVRGKYAKDKVD